MFRGWSDLTGDRAEHGFAQRRSDADANCHDYRTRVNGFMCLPPLPRAPLTAGKQMRLPHIYTALQHP